MLVPLCYANAFAVKPVIACAITTNHECAVVRFATQAVQLVIHLPIVVLIIIIVVVVLFFWVGRGSCGWSWG
jgi:hypothetical protein